MVLPEYLQQLFVADDFRIEYHSYHFRVARLAAAYFAVGRVWRIATAVACCGAVNPLLLPEQAFHSPETPHGEDRYFQAVRHLGHWVIGDHVKRGNRHGSGAAR
ncbi:hypothetical protein D3C81_1953390 [compost metagenome]